MKLFAIFAACLLLAGIAAGDIMEDPNKVKVVLFDPVYGYKIVTAWQNNTTGLWTVAYADQQHDTARIYFGNATGYVRID